MCRLCVSASVSESASPVYRARLVLCRPSSSVVCAVLCRSVVCVLLLIISISRSSYSTLGWITGLRRPNLQTLFACSPLASVPGFVHRLFFEPCQSLLREFGHTLGAGLTRLLQTVAGKGVSQRWVESVQKVLQTWEKQGKRSTR